MTIYTARIYDNGLNLQHTTTNVVAAQGTWRKNDIGSGSFTFPGQDEATLQATIPPNRIVHVTTERAGWTLVVALFNIEGRTYSLGENGEELITVSGSGFESRIGRHLITADIHDGQQGPALDDVAQVVSRLPGWSLNVTSLTGTAEGTRHTFRSATGLQALDAIARQSGEMWRLYSAATIARQIFWMRAPTNPASWNFTLHMPAPAVVNEATDALVVSFERALERKETVTRAYIYGAGTGDDRVTMFGATWTPPAGFSINDSASLMVNNSLEAAGAYCVREVAFSDVTLPELKFRIVFANDAEDYFTISGDYTSLFISGYVFAIEGHPVIADGTEFTTVSSLYDANTDHTVVSVAENIGTSTAGGYIVPTDEAIDAAQEAAANALAKRAYYWLRDNSGGEQFHRVRAIYHRNVLPGDKARLLYSKGWVIINEVHQVVEVMCSIDQATGIRYMDLVLAKLDTLHAPQTEETVAGTIMAAIQNLQRFGPGGRVSAGTILPTMGEHLAHPDPHPTYLLANGGRQLVGNLPVAAGATIDGIDISQLGGDYYAHLPADSHTQYVHVSTARTIPAQHSFSPSIVRAPFLLGGNAQGQTVVGLRADQLDKSVIAGNGLTGGGVLSANVTLHIGTGAGILVDADAVSVKLSGNSGLETTPQDLQMGTPGTLGVASPNAVAGASHTHAITASANPGANSQLLKSDASGHLQLVRLGLGVTPGNPLQVRGTFPQLRLEVDGVHTGTIGVDSSDNLELAAPNNLHLYPAGDVVLNPGGNDILPLNNYDLNLGALHKKYLALHAAELWVETLVAQDTIATIGGRILIGPTTTLEADIDDLTTSIVVKHDQMADGDVVYLEAGGKVEFMEIDSGPSGTGPYTYTVIRNLDGSGANEWFAGDAVFNTGQAGDGFIDLYSLSGVKSGAGPTIAGNVRNSSAFNDWTEHWAIGNLNGLYGYGAETFGVGLGKANANNLVLDAASGIRFRSGSTVMASLTGSFWTLGQTTGAHITLSPTQIVLYNTETLAQLLIDASGIALRNTAGMSVFVLDTSGNYFALPVTLGPNGGIWQGTGTFASPTTGMKLYNDGGYGVLAGYNAGLEQIRIGTDGKLWAGVNKVSLARNGLWLYPVGADTIGIGGPGYVNFGEPTSQTLYGAVGNRYTDSSNYYTELIMTSTVYLRLKRQATNYTAELRAAGGITLTGSTNVSGGLSVSTSLSAGATLWVQGAATFDSTLTAAGNIVGSSFRTNGGIFVGATGISPGQNVLVGGGSRFGVYDAGGTTRLGYIYYPMSPYTHWSGNAVVATTYVITAANMGLPAGLAKAVMVRLTYVSATTGALGYAYPRNGSAAAAGAVARVNVANQYDDDAGIVPCDANGDISVAFTHSGTAQLYIYGAFV